MNARARIHATEVIHKAAGSVAEIHNQCHRQVCAGCEVRRDILDVLRSVADVIGEKATPAGATATPFFQPEHTYRSRHDGYTAPELINTFRVEHVTRHPDRGHLRAIGWIRTGEPGTGWHGDFRDESEYDVDGWTDITGGGETQ